MKEYPETDNDYKNKFLGPGINTFAYVDKDGKNICTK